MIFAAWKMLKDTVLSFVDDEALSRGAAIKMMELLIKELPHATLVSVAHRAELDAFHSRKVVLARRKGGAKLVRDIDLLPRKGQGRLLDRWLRPRTA
jgi:putative ATP-binding cassette transporter